TNATACGSAKRKRADGPLPCRFQRSICRYAFDHSWISQMRTVSVALLLLVLSGATGFAIDPNECEIQRAAYPKDWNDVSKDRSLFTCSSHYSGSIRVFLGAADGAGRRLMTL